jgi:hypothetical protein
MMRKARQPKAELSRRNKFNVLGPLFPCLIFGVQSKVDPPPQCRSLAEHLLNGLLAVGAEENAEIPIAFRALPTVEVPIGTTRLS